MVTAILIATILAVPIPTDTIRVGGPLFLLPLSPGVDTLDNFVIREGEKQLTVRFVQTIQAVEDGYLIVQENRTPSGTVLTLDSVVVTMGTLATVSHSDVTPNGARRVAFSDGRMTGIAVDTAGTEVNVDEPAPSDLFDYSVMTLVADHLPLEAGFQGVLATYDITRGPQYVPFVVENVETVNVRGQTFEAWKMEITVGSTTVTRWIDRSTRKELRWSVDLNGRQMLGERRSAL